MRIGIDAKSFFSGPVSTRVVLQNLLPELLTQFSEHEWIIFLDKRDKKNPFPSNSNHFRLEYVWADVNMLSNVFLLAKRIKSLGIDVMIYQTFPSLRHTALSISFIHDVLFRDFPQFFTWKEKLYFSPMPWLTRNRCDRIIATTNFVSNDLLRYNYTKSKENIDLVPLAVNKSYKPAEYQNPQLLREVKEKYKLPDQFLLFVGRLNVRKNIENLLKAMLLLQNTEIHLVIVGKEDWKTPDLEKILVNPDLRKRIIFTGAMKDMELIMTYSLARIFCFPSFAEGFGLPPLEAMDSGVPVIVSENTALPEVCGDAAVYIDPRKPESIAKAIDTLLENKDLYFSQRVRGLEKATQFTWSLSAKAFMESIYHAVHSK